MPLIMLYGIYSIKYYDFIINEIISLMSQLRQAPTTIILLFSFLFFYSTRQLGALRLKFVKLSGLSAMAHSLAQKFILY